MHIRRMGWSYQKLTSHANEMPISNWFLIKAFAFNCKNGNLFWGPSLWYRTFFICLLNFHSNLTLSDHVP